MNRALETISNDVNVLMRFTNLYNDSATMIFYGNYIHIIVCFLFLFSSWLFQDSSHKPCLIIASLRNENVLRYLHASKPPEFLNQIY